ncbi:alcohol dehydrogenase catalytic domain-containing protein [Arthrobacter sp. ISL-69]|uniref:alcohol dehydrogenase catalytic domain-containing protein n=1 Tax=Arthrobacter sp. ISL-69 TaxID=2819113 RepID=UPI001BE790DA|nr:alcohol dehydrogenase catalytic domain-containing protein [Arthrobacter sp. ISL-69]MBT2535465.1 alcohol dehydrogenase catalytic domain-containing protein [Arthrobacter sp. ISL-69]
MRALKYLGTGYVAWAEAEKPTAGPGQVLLKVSAGGICHTDVAFRAHPGLAIPPGLTLGHEIAGVVSDVGPGVSGLEPGTFAVVHTVWSCGVCRQCGSGRENACLGTGGRMQPPQGPGTKHDGGLATYVTAPASAVIPAPGLAPELAAVLPDAALVPYHSIKDCLALLGPGSSAAVIGLGGLGQFAVSILGAITPARLIALDVRQAALDAVRSSVDFAIDASAPDAARQVLDAAGGFGPDFVLDLVGSSATLQLATSVVAPYGAIRVPGQSDGVLQFETRRTTTSIPRGVTINRPYSGTRSELYDVVALAQAGRIGIDLKTYPFENALDAFDDLEAGRITGRAVVVME